MTAEKKMRKVILRGYAKTVGTQFAEAAVFDDTPESVIDEAAWQAAIDNAAMFGYDFIYDDHEIDEDDAYDNYITDSELGYYWEDYNGEDHDGERCGGGSFEDDFEQLMR